MTKRRNGTSSLSHAEPKKKTKRCGEEGERDGRTARSSDELRDELRDKLRDKLRDEIPQLVENLENRAFYLQDEFPEMVTRVLNLLQKYDDSAVLIQEVNGCDVNLPEYGRTRGISTVTLLGGVAKCLGVDYEWDGKIGRGKQMEGTATNMKKALKVHYESSRTYLV